MDVEDLNGRTTLRAIAARRQSARAYRNPTALTRARLRHGLAIGVDIGGTRVKAGVVDPDGRVLERRSIPTPTSSPEETESAIVRVVSELRRRHRVATVGVGAAGFVDEKRATVLFAPHLAWRREPLRRRLVDRLGLRVVIENDANAAAWAEFRFGAARGEESVVLVTLGTGIGGGIVRRGVLERGRFGIAGEFGHMILVPQGRRCECGNRGCWEQYAGGSALARDARELAGSGSLLAAPLLDAADGRAESVTGHIVAACALAGDAASRDLLRETGEWLGLGLANLAAALDPSVLVVGGGVSGAGQLLLDPAREAFSHTLTGRGFRPTPRIVGASLGNDAGFIGAADLARGTEGHVPAGSPRRHGRAVGDPRAA